jgi:hypothetical protein
VDVGGVMLDGEVEEFLEVHKFCARTTRRSGPLRGSITRRANNGKIRAI